MMSFRGRNVSRLSMGDFSNARGHFSGEEHTGQSSIPKLPRDAIPPLLRIHPINDMLKR